MTLIYTPSAVLTEKSLITQSSLLTQVDLKKEYTLDGKTPVATYYGTPAALLKVIVPNMFIAAGLIVFALLVFGGFSIIFSGGETKKYEEGTKAIMSAGIGFAIVITAYWVIQIIELFTGLKIFL
jgi:hypothetical protein